MPLNIAPIGLAKDLLARADTGKPITIGLIGCGEMGTDIVTRVAHMPGLRIGAIAERRADVGIRAAEIAYREAGHAGHASNASDVSKVMESGRIAVTDDANLVLEAGEIDVVVDATGVPAVGAAIGLQARWSAASTS